MKHYKGGPAASGGRYVRGSAIASLLRNGFAAATIATAIYKL